MLNAFTVDVEDYFQVSAFERIFPPERWDETPLRVDKGMGELLRIADDAGVHGTFFVLGWLARRRPDLVRTIAAAGHEVGCHGNDHRLIYSMSPESFRRDVADALAAVEDSLGAPCVLYRAPSYSVTPRSRWALDILAENGIRIDSSIYPIRHDRYGWEGSPEGPYRPLRDHQEFVEFPPSAVRLFGMMIPCAGGGYLRLYPLSWTLAAIRRIHRAAKRPAMVYVHPWELDPGQPVVPAGLTRNLRHRVNLGRTGARLRRLFREFRFGPLSGVVDSLGGPAALPFADLGADAAESRASVPASRRI